VTQLRVGPQTEMAIEAVRQGLALAQAQAGAAVVTAKGGRDIVTSADVAVEDVIREILSGQPALPVVGEEQGGQAPADGSAYWLVDPVCGTRNYASGTSLYSVNVALAEGGQINAAVIGDPSENEVMVAERGAGAWAAAAEGLAAGPGADWRRLQTSDLSLTAAVEPGRSAGPRRARAAAVIAEIVRADQWEFRSLASTLSLPYVAAGRLAAWAVFWTDSPVHCAAGSLLVTEAGGMVSDLDGGAWTVGSDSCMASANLAVHAELLELLAKWPE
jgi:myo-inositol-1(or 4)-monophosphatase